MKHSVSSFLNEFNPKKGISFACSKDQKIWSLLLENVFICLDKGICPWIDGWFKAKSNHTDLPPTNLISGKSYTGISVLLLNAWQIANQYQDPYYATYSQIKSQNGKLKQNCTPIKICCFFPQVNGSKIDPPEEQDGEGGEEPIQYLSFGKKIINLYNVGFHCKGKDLNQLLIKQHQKDGKNVDSTWNLSTIQSYIPSSCTLKTGDSIEYHLVQDQIVLPPLSEFVSEFDYIWCLLFCICLSTIHIDRCKRVYDSCEELKLLSEHFIASCTASMIIRHLNWNPPPYWNLSVSYCEIWTGVLKSNPKLIPQLYSDCKECFDFLIHKKTPEQRIQSLTQKIKSANSSQNVSHSRPSSKQRPKKKKKT